jgi:hypothetical protein
VVEHFIKLNFVNDINEITRLGIRFLCTDLNMFDSKHLQPNKIPLQFFESSFWTFCIVFVSIKLQRFVSYIFFRFQVKKKRIEPLAVGDPG